MSAATGQKLSATSPEAKVGPLELAGMPGERRRSRTPWLIAGIVLVGAGVAVALSDPFSAGGTNKPGVVNDPGSMSLYTVVRQNLTSQTDVSATLGYAESYNIVNQAQGTVTAIPAVGQVVRQGQVLFQVSGAPVVLLYGSTPAYRTLSPGVIGADVAELNADLVDLGDATSTELPSGTAAFTYWTEVGVKKLQAALGETQNGSLSLGQAVYAPAAVRVTMVSATLGSPIQPGEPVLAATSTTRQVSIALDASEQSEVAVGDKVSIILPNNQTTPGTISSVGTVATPPGSGSSDSSPTITVLVNPTDTGATGTWDQAPVNVTITTGNVSHVLVVPVDALLAQSGGTYAVEVAGAHRTRHLVTVTLGLFDDADGLVQVSGPKLSAGERVVVPNL